MPIPATNPTTLSATYDKWAFTFTTLGDGCASLSQNDAGPVRAAASMVKARIREDGTWERSPNPADYQVIEIPDLYALAASDEVVAAALAAIIAAVQHVATQQGKI